MSFIDNEIIRNIILVSTIALIVISLTVFTMSLDVGKLKRRERFFLFARLIFGLIMMEVAVILGMTSIVIGSYVLAVVAILCGGIAVEKLWGVMGYAFERD